ncbi:ATP-binding protein [Candidatus Eisenbacteria bacterium]|uniref:ATP-binding protein n=1 Tax=Eiseniibacteriota bacterium TaxID=2212470 RepID=A0ABV6YIK8_UNCEI
MREILEELIDDFQERDLPRPIPRDQQPIELRGKATVVVGMRRVGKTWFCYQQIQRLLEEGVPKEQLLYLNFEDERLLPFGAKDFQTILDVYFSRLPALKDVQCHFFLDEVQRIDGWEMFVRRVLDNERISVWITGFSSRLLSREIATSLRGRSLPTEIFPLSFAEFLRFQGVELPSPRRFGTRTRAILQNMAQRYLDRGGFPELQSVESDEIRRQVLRNHLDVVLLRDVVERYSVTNVAALRRLIRHIMSAPATRFSVNKFYNSLRSQGISCTKDNLYQYLDHLVDAYLVHQASIHSRSEKVRQVNPRKIYTCDSGYAGAGLTAMTMDRGAILENMVYTHLRRQGLRPEYVMMKNGLEVDFFLPARRVADRLLIQVCWTLENEATRRREVTAIREGIRELRLKAGTIVTWNEHERIDDKIEAVPAYRWLLEDQSID